MVLLEKTLRAWGSQTFSDNLKIELAELDDLLDYLQKAMSGSSYATTEGMEILILSMSERNEIIEVDVGVFYSGLVPGCNCSDDPSPESVNQEYCELSIKLDKRTAAATIQSR